MSNYQAPVDFQDAERQQCKASIMLEGLTGRGKTGTALWIAIVLAEGDWQKIFITDTEMRSSNLFRNTLNVTGERFGKFKVAYLDDVTGFTPSHYLALKDKAVAAGGLVFIGDSTTHAWQYKGGVLDLLSQVKVSDAQLKLNKHAAWGDPKVVEEKNNLLPMIRDDRIHVITTVRVKEKMEYEKEITDKGEKNKLVSLGEQQMQQPDLKYEPDLVLRLLSPGHISPDGNEKSIKYPRVLVMKSRYTIFELDQEYDLTPQLLEQLRVYLKEGADPAELAEMQRQDYIQLVKTYLDNNAQARPIWKALKTQQNLGDMALEDIPLDILKRLYITIIQ